MPKFVFRLQPLLNVKLQMEDSMKNELGKATQKLEEEKQNLLSIENDMECSRNELTAKSSDGIAVDELRQYGAYISLLRNKAVQQKEMVNIAYENVDRCRGELLKVTRERQMFEKLKEKKFQEYLKEENKIEQKLIDEKVSYNYSKAN